MGKLYLDPKPGCAHRCTHVVTEEHGSFAVEAIVCSSCGYIVESISVPR